MCAHVAPVCVDAHVCVCVRVVCKEKGIRWGRGRGRGCTSKRSAVCGYCIEEETESRMGEQMDGGLD